MSSASDSEDYVDIGDSDKEWDFQTDVESDEANLKRRKRQTTKRQERMRSNKQKERTKEYTKIWSDYEKKTLLNLLNEHGDDNIEKLALGLPNKHGSQIKTYLRTISRRTLQEEKNRAKSKELLELDKWIDYLKGSFSGLQIDDTVPYELLASSRELPPPNEKLVNEVVDFPKAYEYLSALTVGRKIDLDDKTYYFIHSYLDWFIKNFAKSVVTHELSLLKSALKKLKVENVDSTVTPLEILHLIFHKVVLNELFNYRYLLKTICKKVKHTCFNKGEEYDRKISLLRAELDEELARSTDCNFDSPEFNIVPNYNDVKLKNLTTYIWGALFNFDIEHMKACS